jgi:hypothetical protein
LPRRPTPAEPASAATAIERSDGISRPYVYLGATGGTLVLYDYVADRANEVPTSFPLRMPSSGITVRLAHFNPSGPNAVRWVNWDCGENV